MIIDPRKVNLSEKDIEDWLWENPGAVTVRDYAGPVRIFKWIGRQVTVPSGIIDLLGITEHWQIAVVEVKNVELRAEALTQVKRYAFDVEHIIRLANLSIESVYETPDVLTAVVGPSFEDKIFREAEALDIVIVAFHVNLSLDTGTRQYTDQFHDDRSAQWADIARTETFVNAIAYRNGYWDTHYSGEGGDTEETGTEQHDNIATADELGLE